MKKILNEIITKRKIEELINHFDSKVDLSGDFNGYAIKSKNQ
jgi:hypothetical protein